MRHMLRCFLQTASGLDRESAAEIVLCCLETSACGIFSLQNALLSTNFGSTGRLHYFSAVHKVRAHASYMGVISNSFTSKMITNSKLHHTLIKKIIEDGYAPTNKALAELFGTTETEVISALHELQDYHGVVLHPNEPKVWVIHPFSLAPTNFYIKSDQGQWWGNCAWCSLGVAALLKTDLTISTTIGAEGTPKTIHIKDGEIVETDLFIHFPIPMRNAWDNVIYTCSNMLVFETEQQVKNWSVRHNIPLGDIQPIHRIWEFSKKWYGSHLDPNWVKWTAEDARRMFIEFGLTHPTWDLETSGKRF